jgi:SNF2 family DNA or RNA helicase
VDLPASVRRHYRELEKELFTRFEGGGEVEAFNAASLTMKCLQAANGAIYLDPDRYPPVNGEQVTIEIHDAKLQALESVVEEAAGMPVLVAYHFKSDLARIQRAFPQARALDADPGTIRDWNAGRIPMLLAHPASAGHGLNLQDGGNILVFFGLWWDLEQHEQIIERIGPTRQAQSGHNRPVYVHRIVARKTVDELVLRRLKTKASVQSLLLDAMKGER